MSKKVLLGEEIPENEKHLYKPMNRAQRRAYEKKNKKEWRGLEHRQAAIDDLRGSEKVGSPVRESEAESRSEAKTEGT